MKPFDLQKALAGEPVKLRNGLKAYIKYNLTDYPELKPNIRFPLRGFYISKDSKACDDCWNIDGSNSLEESNYDIVSMYEEPQPRVQLDLPCPLKEPQDEMWYIDRTWQVSKSVYGSNTDKKTFELRFYFGSKEDATEWLNAMRNSRR